MYLGKIEYFSFNAILTKIKEIENYFKSLCE